MRGTTRRPDRAAALEAEGIEPWVGDPDRIGSLVYAQDNVTVVCWLLGRVALAPLHGPRLRMMLEKSVDTMVRGFAYEPPADAALRAQGLAVLRGGGAHVGDPHRGPRRRSTFRRGATAAVDSPSKSPFVSRN